MEHQIILKGLVPVSVNDMYMPRPCKGGRSAYLTKTNRYREFEKLASAELENLVSDQVVERLKEQLLDHQKVISMEFLFRMSSKEFYRSDSSNHVKSIEDLVKSRIGIDDSRNVEVRAHKVLANTSEEVCTEVYIRIYELDFIVESKWR